MPGGGRASGAHPRACGENPSRASMARTYSGSSPRVRGKQAPSVPHVLVRGLIPARAGKTLPAASCVIRAMAHPRACGENRFSTDALLREDGSSPRVRGKLLGYAWAAYQVRLIPARAGKTPKKSSSSSPGRAHPRACGENCCGCGLVGDGDGSSPRVRGKPVPVNGGDVPEGLIPARAGKTSHSGVNTFSPWAHPRACGENSARG